VNRERVSVGAGLFHGRHAEIIADFERQDVTDFGVAGNRGALFLGRVVPPGMACTFAKHEAAVFPQVA
jgi:hypothetical protein